MDHLEDVVSSCLERHGIQINDLYDQLLHNQPANQTWVNIKIQMATEKLKNTLSA